ncbi:MAG: hypothetical protein IT180_13165 [Acidobacteria bacterium]|nr:hypothetical protein [Acidobacteriota bacterium]
MIQKALHHARRQGCWLKQGAGPVDRPTTCSTPSTVPWRTPRAVKSGTVGGGPETFPCISPEIRDLLAELARPMPPAHLADVVRQIRGRA